MGFKRYALKKGTIIDEWYYWNNGGSFELYYQEDAFTLNLGDDNGGGFAHVVPKNLYSAMGAFIFKKMWPHTDDSHVTYEQAIPIFYWNAPDFVPNTWNFVRFAPLTYNVHR